MRSKGAQLGSAEKLRMPRKFTIEVVFGALCVGGLLGLFVGLSLGISLNPWMG